MKNIVVTILKFYLMPIGTFLGQKVQQIVIPSLSSDA